jgi:hypothetical protein
MRFGGVGKRKRPVNMADEVVEFTPAQLAAGGVITPILTYRPSLKRRAVRASTKTASAGSTAHAGARPSGQVR